MSDGGTATFNSHVRLGDNKTASFGAGNDIEITSDGTNGTIGAPNGNLTLDVAGNIILDADGGFVAIKDGGTEIGNLGNSSSDFAITSSVQDKDIIFKGNDNGSVITALKLDMSAGGAATLNNGLTLTDGNVVVANGHGIDFSANANAGGMTSELLDDYEVGTFTPAFSGATSTVTVDYNTAIGLYTKIGNLVHIEIRIVTNSVSGGSGNLSITGLPFTSRSGSGISGAFTKAFVFDWATDPEVFLTSGASFITIYSSDAGNTQAQVSHLKTSSSGNYTTIAGAYLI